MGGDHKCSVCQATFTRPQHVARHMRSREFILTSSFTFDFPSSPLLSLPIFPFPSSSYFPFPSSVFLFVFHLLVSLSRFMLAIALSLFPPSLPPLDDYELLPFVSLCFFVRGRAVSYRDQYSAHVGGDRAKSP